MVTTHLVLYQFFPGSTPTAAPANFGGYITGALAFFGGFTPSDAPEPTGLPDRRFIANMGRLMGMR